MVCPRFTDWRLSNRYNFIDLLRLRTPIEAASRTVKEVKEVSQTVSQTLVKRVSSITSDISSGKIAPEELSDAATTVMPGKITLPPLPLKKNLIKTCNAASTNTEGNAGAGAAPEGNQEEQPEAEDDALLKSFCANTLICTQIAEATSIFAATVFNNPYPHPTLAESES